MHELSIAEALLALCRERLQPGDRLVRVRIAVGELASIEPDQLQFAWQAVVADGDHAAAELAIDWHAARQTCGTCGDVPVKSISAERDAASTRIATWICAPLSSGSVNAPSFSRVMTRRTDSSALSCTCRM